MRPFWYQNTSVWHLHPDVSPPAHNLLPSPRPLSSNNHIQMHKNIRKQWKTATNVQDRISLKFWSTKIQGNMGKTGLWMPEELVNSWAALEWEWGMLESSPDLTPVRGWSMNWKQNPEGIQCTASPLSFQSPWKTILGPKSIPIWEGLSRLHQINHSPAPGGLAGICLPSISISNFMYSIRVMLNLCTWRPYSSFASLCSFMLFMAEANIGQNLSLKEALWTSVKNKMCLLLSKQAQLSPFLSDLRRICCEQMKTKCTKAFWIRIYRKPLKKFRPLNPKIISPWGTNLWSWNSFNGRNYLRRARLNQLF